MLLALVLFSYAKAFDDVTTLDLNEGAIDYLDDVTTPDINEGYHWIATTSPRPTQTKEPQTLAAAWAWADNPEDFKHHIKFDSLSVRAATQKLGACSKLLCSVWGATEEAPMTSPRRFSPPWQVEQVPGGFKVGQALVYVYARETLDEAQHAKVLTFDEARRIAANVAKLELLKSGGK